jgi:hypothetical protein
MDEELFGELEEVDEIFGELADADEEVEGTLSEL